MISKIKKVTPMDGYEGKYGYVYKQMVELENGTSGAVGAQTENKWSVGDSVEYVHTPDAFGGKMKLSYPKEQPAYGGQAQSNHTPNNDAQAGFVLSYAKDCWIAGKIEKEQMVDLAVEFFNMKEEIKSKI